MLVSSDPATIVTDPAMADCSTIVGDELDRVVAWKKGPDLSALPASPSACDS